MSRSYCVFRGHILNPDLADSAVAACCTIHKLRKEHLARSITQPRTHISEGYLNSHACSVPHNLASTSEPSFLGLRMRSANLKPYVWRANLRVRINLCELRMSCSHLEFCFVGKTKLAQRMCCTSLSQLQGLGFRITS